MYFEVDDYFFFDGDETFEVTVEYLDQGAREFLIEYDSSDPRLVRSGSAIPRRAAPADRRQRPVEAVTMKIEHARFAGRSNNADFRLNVLQGDLAVSKVTVRRVAKTQ
jgi:hypothetical protein